MTTLNKNPLSKLISSVPGTMSLRVGGRSAACWYVAYEDVNLSSKTPWRYFLELNYDSPIPQRNWSIGKYAKGSFKDLEQKD